MKTIVVLQHQTLVTCSYIQAESMLGYVITCWQSRQIWTVPGFFTALTPAPLFLGPPFFEGILLIGEATAGAVRSTAAGLSAGRAVLLVTATAAGSALIWLAVLSSALFLFPVLPLMVRLPKFQASTPYMAFSAVTCQRHRNSIGNCSGSLSSLTKNMHQPTC